MMKKSYIFSIVSIVLLAFFTVQTASAQTMKVFTGQVGYAYKAANVGEMTFANGTTLTIDGKTFNISDITNITVDESSVADNTVKVVYGGTTSSVIVAGNIAKYITASAQGGVVSVVQDAALQQEVTYTLTGTSTNGSFHTNGEFKATFILDNLSLTSTNGPAIDIQNGKAIALTLKGTSTLADAAGGTHTAAFYINGHPTISGAGSLNVSGRTKHALQTDEKLVMKSGTINVTQAIGDGIHINERFQMDGGTINVTAAGDGIDVEFRGVNKGTKDLYEKNGFLELNGGTLNISTSGTATKAIKADSTIIINGATVTATTSGESTYDTVKKDTSSPSAVKTDGEFQMLKGTLTATSTGSGGKGINATGNVTISGGKIFITTTGGLYKYDDLDSKPQGIKSDGNITITGGTAYVCAGSYEGNATAFKPGTGKAFYINGGNVIGVSRKKTTVSSASTQSYSSYTKVNVTGGQTLSYDDLTYTVPTNYSITEANVVVSKEPVTEFSGAKPTNP